MAPSSFPRYRIVHLNIRGIRWKKLALMSYITENDFPEFVCLNETLLGSAIRFEIPGYDIASRKEPTAKGGARGSMILSKSNLKNVLEILPCKSNFQEELIGVTVQNAVSSPLNIFCYYNPPATSPNPNIMSFVSTFPGHSLLVGDLNCKHLSYGSTKTDALGISLVTAVEDNNLFILNDGTPTRTNPINGSEEVLDVAICNRTALSIFSDFHVGDDLGSDHNALHITLGFSQVKNPPPKSYRNPNRCNWSEYCQFFQSYTLGPIESENELETAAELFSNTVLSAFEGSCLTSNPRKRRSYRFEGELKAKVQEKRKLMRQKSEANKRGNLIDVMEINNKINRLRRQIKIKTQEEQKYIFRQHCDRLNKADDPRKFFQAFKLISDPLLKNDLTSPKCQPIEADNGVLAKTPKEKADMFAERLKKIHRTPEYEDFDGGWKTSVERYLSSNNNKFSPNCQMKDVLELGDDVGLTQDLTVEEIKKNLVKCKNQSAAGLDRVSYRMLKELPNETIQQLASLMSACIKCGYFPKVWKHALTKMLPKPGKPSNKAANYRPISLLSCVGKLFERCIAARLYSYLESKNLLNPHQSGYRSKRSINDHLLRLVEDSFIGFKHQQVTAALFLDAEAAFDKCWHQGIKYKLDKNLNLPMKTIRLLSSFLNNRTLIVEVEGERSDLVNLLAGTPQGSCLSPLIYLIYVNDMPFDPGIGASMSQFADDICIWATGKDAKCAVAKLQQATDLIQKWCLKWRVKMNPSKSKLVLFSRKTQDPNPPSINLFKTWINPVPEAKFLGLTLDSQLRFKTHIEEVEGRARQRLNVIRALAGAGVDKNRLMKLYKTYIRPLMESGSIAFLNVCKTRLNRLQIVQNDAIRACLKLPMFISIPNLHDAASIPQISDRLLTLSKKQLASMEQNYPLLKHLYLKKVINKKKELSHISPLDILKPDICLTMDITGKIIVQ